MEQEQGPFLLSVSIGDRQVLRRCYLPFLRNGGLFIPGPCSYQLRQRVCLIMKLPAPSGAGRTDVTHAVMATVAWLALPDTQNARGVGVGLHFDGVACGSDQTQVDVKKAIESQLAALV